MRKHKNLESQGENINVSELEDEVWVRNEQGELIKLEVEDDVEDDQA